MKKDKVLLGDLQALTVFYFEDDRNKERYIASSKTRLDVHNRPRRVVMNMNNGQLRDSDILIPVVVLGSTKNISWESEMYGLEGGEIIFNGSHEWVDGVEDTRRTPNNALADFGKSLDEMSKAHERLLEKIELEQEVIRHRLSR